MSYLVVTYSRSGRAAKHGNALDAHHLVEFGAVKTLCGRDCFDWPKDPELPTGPTVIGLCKRCAAKHPDTGEKP